MATIYNNHLNLALNFSKKFTDTLNSQVEAMFKLQKKTINPLEMATNWWKKDGQEKGKEEKVKVKAYSHS